MKTKKSRTDNSKLGGPVGRTPRLTKGDIPVEGARSGTPSGADANLLRRLIEQKSQSEPARSAMPSGVDAEITSVSGIVSEEKSGLPLAGVTVKWILGGASTRRVALRIELGSAVTDDEGHFLIDTAKDPKARAALSCAQSGGDGRKSKTYLYLADRNGKMLGRPVEVTTDMRETVLHPPVAAKKVGKQQWKALTNYLTTNRMMLVRDVAQQLARPFADSPVSNWTVPARASALRGILQAAAAEDRKSAETIDLLYQNQFIETTALGAGNLRRAVNYFKDVANLERFGRDFERIFPWVRETDLSLYRDYLRGVWVGAAQMMYENEEHIAKPAVALLERQLDERFEQDFHTLNDASKPVANLLVPLLGSILKRDASRGGFGLSAADLPARGAQTDDEYLQSLIALSKVSPKELRNRFRVSFERNPGETSSPLQLNVEALLGLLADTYQSPQEPFHAVPMVVEGKPLIFGPYIGRAPFFLEYEEWLERQRTFFPENIYDIRKNVALFYPQFRNLMKGDSAYTGAPSFPGQGYFDRDPGERARSAAWVERMFPIADKLREAFAKIDGQLYPDALAKLGEVSDLLKDADKKYEWPWVMDKFWWLSKSGSWNNVPSAYKKHYLDVWISLVDRAKIKVTTPEQLDSFERFFEEPVYNSDYEVREKGLAKSRTLYHYGVFYFNLVLIPYLRAQIYFAQGDFAKALTAITCLTGYRVGIAETTIPPGYATLSEPLPGQDQTEDPFARYPRLHHLTTLPYTTLVGFTEDKSGYENLPVPVGSMGAMVEWKNIVIAPFEVRFFKLAQAEVMLAWADQLYRNDDPSSIRRARELYKGVLFMHGEDPEIAPHFPRDGQFERFGRFGFGVMAIDPIFWKQHENPAKVSQIFRARLALFQIEQGLNVYGYREDMVPVLRYKPLKQAADLFATSAKSAQTDFLSYMTRYEQALIELWQTQSLVKKAQASSGIASEHTAIAQVGVDKAKEQVAAVEAQIAAKKKEIADKNSLFEQFSDYLSGAKDALTGLVPLAEKVMAEDGAASSSGVTGGQMLDIFSKGASGGSGAASDAASATLGSGAAFMIGYGAFVYASYSSMENMASAAAKRDGELKSLETGALGAANAQVRLKQRDVAIAQYESQIAAADLEFARTLLRFQQDRFLNADFWNKLTLFANRLMRRYVELGARTAWMAERALAFEQNRAISIIRMNYLPAALRGVTGADRLLADLAELEANRIQGTRLTTPVKHTISLAREFPLQFGQLKKTGLCRFHTREIDLRYAYPGTFAYRIRAITVAAHDSDGPAPRGVLRNGGISAVSSENLTSNILVRYPDALALSEFRLHDDLFVYGLPGETLMQFEGSGFETDWELEFPVDANPKGFRSVADVLITFDTNAYYSDTVAAKQAAQAPADAVRSIMLAASNLDPKGLATLKAATGVTQITFDPTKLALPSQETKRQIANIALICVGKTTKQYQAKLTAAKSSKTASFSFKDGIALSNAGPLLGTASPLPLNILVGLNLNQPFVLEIDRTGVAAELKELFDVVLYVEYQATF